MESEKKIFAFKLAEKKQSGSKGAKWKAREGISLASCTEVTPDSGNWRSYHYYGGGYAGPDKGYYC